MGGLSGIISIFSDIKWSEPFYPIKASVKNESSRKELTLNSPPEVSFKREFIITVTALIWPWWESITKGVVYPIRDNRIGLQREGEASRGLC